MLLFACTVILGLHVFVSYFSQGNSNLYLRYVPYFMYGSIAALLANGVAQSRYWGLLWFGASLAQHFSDAFVSRRL